MALALTLVCLFTMKPHAAPDGCLFTYHAETPPGYQLTTEFVSSFVLRGFPGYSSMLPGASIRIQVYDSGAEACAARRDALACGLPPRGPVWIVDGGPCQIPLHGPRGGLRIYPHCAFEIADDLSTSSVGGP